MRLGLARLETRGSVEKKLLLVIPPCFLNRDLDFEIGFPIHLVLLGRVAQDSGWEVEYLDMTLEEKEGCDSFALLDERLSTPGLSLVGISNHTVRTSVTTRAVAERVKALRGDVPIVVGGVNATFMWRELLEGCPAIDFVLRGYAQAGLDALLARLTSSSAEEGVVPGLVQRSEAGLRLDPMTHPLASDFESSAFDGLDVQRYLRWTRTYPLLTHTGCGFSCNFCTSVMPGPYQSREVHFPVEQVVDEMAHATALGFDHFFMSANILTSNRPRCVELCEAIVQAGIPNVATWSCMTRVEFVDHEVLGIMRKAGCVDVAFGVEIAGPEQWKSLGKGSFSSDRVARAFDACRRNDLATTAYLMVGAPDQTAEDVEMTVELVRVLDPTFRVVSFFQPFPGTPYWKDRERFGISEVAPIEEWNFHEAPVCRTRHMSKEDLLGAAVRLHLDRGQGRSRLNPNLDTLTLACFPQDSVAGHPAPSRQAFSLVNGRNSIERILGDVSATHGPRGRLIALYSLSAALRDGWLKVAGPAYPDLMQKPLSCL